MEIISKIEKYAAENSAELSEKRGIYKFVIIVAERKAFLSHKKLQYIAKFRMLDDEKIIKFTEMLFESGSGLSGEDASPGFGFKVETYNTFKGERSGSIAEQSDLFGKKYYQISYL